MKYDLEERTAVFAEEVLQLCTNIARNTLNTPIIHQLVKSSTSVGANYREANGGSSRKDFRNKIHLCKKEAKETHYWLRIMKKFVKEQDADERERLEKEAHELVLIFGKIAISSSDKLKQGQSV